MTNFSPGDRVEFAPYTDQWARGDRYGMVLTHGDERVLVLAEKSGATIHIVLNHLTLVRKAGD